MKDPVTGFSYPEGWIRACRTPGRLGDVERGLAVLAADGTVLRRGFTTGTTAAAACRASILSLAGDVSEVTVTLPAGMAVTLPARGRGGEGRCTKDAGDHPSDATAGLEFIARAETAPGGITLHFGEGIGRFVRDTPRYPRGAPAVSPPALSTIEGACRAALAETGRGGVTVTLRVPGGRELARRTLNPRLGIEGGISILGTTGLVEPWDEHLAESVLERVRAAEKPVLTTGRTGLRHCRLLFPGRDVILVGGRIREALEAVQGEAILCGLPGLILRELNPNILEGTGRSTVEELLAGPGGKERMEASLAAFHRKNSGIRVILLDRDGKILGETP